ncbi:hypothetical protein AL064_23625 [Pseudomonas syringae pv. syringae]|nr:hypothetical protein AL064_23625 [Pseudomonas syringae pv. syringae]
MSLKTGRVVLISTQTEAEALLDLVSMRQKVIQTFAQACDLIMQNARWNIWGLEFVVIGYGRCEACQACAIQQGKTQRIPSLIQFVQQCQKLSCSGGLEHHRETIRDTWEMTQFGCQNTFLSTQDEQPTHLIEARLQASVSARTIGAVQPPAGNLPQ